MVSYSSNVFQFVFLVFRVRFDCQRPKSDISEKVIKDSVIGGRLL